MCYTKFFTEVDNVKTKMCARCKEIKSEHHFCLDKYNKDGLKTYCKECHSWFDMRRINRISEMIEKVDRKSTYKTCKVCKKKKPLTQFKIHTTHHDGFNTKCNVCLKKHQTKHRKYRMKHDELYAFKVKIRGSISSGFKRKNYKKETKTESILGCTWEYAKKHIESRFLPGMTWENHGILWDIDHIIPMAIAKTQKEVLLLNNINNLQPLWSEDNRWKKKGKCPKVSTLWSTELNEMINHLVD